jgi:hypothetical protein
MRSNMELYNTGTGYGTAGTVSTAVAGTQTLTPAAVVNGCSDSSSLPLLKAGAAQANNASSCVVGLTGASWVAYVTLNSQTSPANFCVDSNGFAGLLTGAPAAVAITAAVKCQ